MNLSKHIEHTNLSPQITGDDVEQLIQEASDHGFHGICVPPFWVKKARRDLGNSACQLVTVAGFPLGYQMTETKIRDIELSLRDGADEIDLVWHISAFKAQMIWPKIELTKASKLVHDSGKLLKVIIETAYLSADEIKTAALICRDAGADFVKTSTGFAPSGARLEDVRLLREVLPAEIRIKASGGIKTKEQALAFIEAGADRIGTSSGIKIIAE